MKLDALMFTATATGLTLGASFLLSRVGTAATGDKDLRPAIQKVADAIKNNDAANAKQLAEDLAKSNELLDVMNTLEKRDPAGKKAAFGVGDKPGTISPDGVEAKIQNMSRRPQPQKVIDTESADLVQMAYRVAAIAEVARIKVPEKE